MELQRKHTENHWAMNFLTFWRCTSTTTASSSTATGGLDGHMKAKGKKYFGTCTDQGLLSVSQNVAIIKSDFGALTPENSASKFNYVPRFRS